MERDVRVDMRSFDLREVRKEAMERGADLITILFAMKNGTLENVRKHEKIQAR
jgi:hypothetical protein